MFAPLPQSPPPPQAKLQRIKALIGLLNIHIVVLHFTCLDFVYGLCISQPCFLVLALPHIY